MAKNWMAWGAILAMAAVALGAFGAHGLKEALSPERLEIFHTGVRYQFYHAFALLFLGLWAKSSPENRMIPKAGVAFMIGIVLFSGSLYVLSIRDLLSWPVGWLGPVTPLGGVAFIIGWVLVLVGVNRD
ncbi:DUF423 domain-containing protein [Flavilitoribacter nigricans]|uniref:DUF423 domain-containing protein n=1 Tax=Flavilitoribacter nigricans (strain ATCC 23147 / DSM 23189 / NBRC 102662 / NCIMB 1420 / SS-2) TaxID=1122177 RepID=A0A2D0NG92_FLAN2|nr:DUF423 domain-containing protein [Flavilitoribacter nigricans]PHN07524.1 hypothetical protein CRP01_05330 [Flavilitoribacter nigricans DSM 23189 = NBRC 102662]